MHQPAHLAKAGTLEARMILSPTVSPDHHAPQSSGAGCLGAGQIDLL